MNCFCVYVYIQIINICKFLDDKKKKKRSVILQYESKNTLRLL